MRRFFSSKRGLVLGIVVALCVAAVFVAVYARRAALSRVEASFAGTPVEPPKPAQDFALVDGSGKAQNVLRPGTPLEFLFFGYTHCPDECPLAMASLGRAYRLLTPAARAGTRVVFVTVDPARDTPNVVRDYVARFDPHFIGLTGSASQLASVRRAYGVEIDAKTKELAHGDAIYAIDVHHNVVLVYPPDTAATELAGDAEKFVN